MKKWRTTVTLHKPETEITRNEIRIEKPKAYSKGTRSVPCGSALLLTCFRICLMTQYGYKLKSKNTGQHTVNHLFYMDDLKVYAQTPRQLKYILDIITTFSGHINMKLGVNKCKIIETVKGKHKEGQEYPLKEGGPITNMNENETYKYLGIGQNARITHKEIKNRVTKEYKERLNRILKTSLNSRNMIKAINTCAIPVLTYTFGTIQWSDMELEQLNRLTRVALMKARAHHPKSVVERLYLP
jgi:hypothetical protein